MARTKALSMALGSQGAQGFGAEHLVGLSGCP